jgi:benzoyl-CoA reductase/2-hydroxyglutaryl-CoA dehydratase subunit BcrC/BadD/HgdB
MPDSPPIEAIEKSPVPTPDLAVVEDIQAAILEGLIALPARKAEGKKVVWTSVVIPQAIFHAMGVPAMYQELLGGYVSIFRLSAKYCQAAEEAGLSRDVCAAHRCAVGVACCDDRDYFFEQTFVPPDLVVGTNFPCMSESRSCLHVAERYGCPVFMVDTPVNTWGRTIPDHAVRYYADQLRALVRFLEGHGYRLDMDKLKEQVALTKRVNALMSEVDLLKRAVPSPMRAYDTVIAMTAPLALPIDQRLVGYFERLRDELADRVAKGVGVVPDERLRLLWIGIPPLCDFELLNHTERHGAVVVKNMLEFLTGFTLDPALIDPEQPFESLARAQLASPANPLLQTTIDYFVNAVRDYRVDGVISVVKRTCGFIPGMQRLIKDAILRETGVPSVVFDLDGVDQREYDAATTQHNLDTFVETLLTKKGRN